MPQYLQFILVAVVIQACVCAILPNDPRIDVQHRSDIVSKEIGQRFNKGLKRSVTGQKKVMELEPSAEPTTEPTLSEDLPSAEPTLFPTHLASSSAGYYYFTNSFNSDCSDPVASAGEPANKCLTDDDSTSYMIRLEDDNWNTASMDFFSDPHCQELSNNVPLTDDLVKCQVTDWPIVTDPSNKGGKVYSQMHITTSSTPPRNGPAGGALFEYFNDDTSCAPDSLTSFTSFTAYVCLTVTNKKETQSTFSVQCNSDAKSVRMNIDLDSKPNCAGTIFPWPLPDTCEPAVKGDDDDYDYETESKLRSLLSTPATHLASSPVESFERVTCQPSQKAFTFKVIKQTINDFSVEAYNSDVALYSLTLKQAIAATMKDVQASDITDMLATASATRASADAVRATLRTLVARALQSSSSVDLAYTVSGMSQYTSSQLAAQLQTALTSGEFNSVLHLLAAQNGAIELRNATSSSVETDINDDDSDDPVLSTGAIVGIVVGAVVFVAIIVGIVVCLMRREAASTKDAGTIALVNLG